MISKLDIEKRIISKIEDNTIHLPNFPEIIVKINNVINDNTKNLTDIEAIIHHDMVLTSRILQIVNSPAIRGHKEISSVKDAITILGIQLIKNLVLCASIRDKFMSDNPILKKILVDAFDQSMLLAIYNYTIVKSIKCDLNPDIAFTIGLLNNIGILPIVGCFEKCCDAANLTEVEICDIVNDIKDDIGKVILSRWEFPYEIILSIYNNGPAGISLTYGNLLILSKCLLNNIGLETEDEICADNKFTSITLVDLQNILEDKREELNDLVKSFSSHS